ncbi:hypothetical protein Tco_1285900 [Tanacetum coccineum]
MSTITTPHPTPFHATTPRARVFAPFVIISDSDDKITTLPVRPTPPLPDRTPALYGYPLDSGDDSSDEDLSKTVGLLHIQTASTSAVHPPSTRPLPTSPAFSSRQGKEISMPLGYIAAMDRWRFAPPSICHLLLPSEIPSSSSPPSFLPSSSSPPPSLLPSSSPTVPPPEIARGKITRLQLRVVYAEHESREIREFWVTDRLEIIVFCSRAEYTENCLEQTHERQIVVEAQRTNMIVHDMKALGARDKAVEQQAKTLQVSQGAAQMGVKDLIESHEAKRLEIAKL